MTDAATTGDPRKRALAIYERITRSFVTNYDESVSLAYRQLLKDLMQHSSLLIEGQIFTGKEMLDKTEDLQAHLKQGGDEGRGTMADQFSDWLNLPPGKETRQ